MMPTLFKSISAEFIKLKRTPILWLIFIGGATISAIAIFRQVTNPYYDIALSSPWPYYFDFHFNLIALLFLSLFVILMVHLLTSLEEQANAWKQLYTLPFAKGYIYFSKLIALVLILLFTLLSYIVLSYITGHIIDQFVPEYEFSFYRPEWGRIMGYTMHLFCSVLGILGIQYWLSMQHRNYLIPLGIGVLGFVIGLLLFILNLPIGAYFPYTYVMHVNVTFIHSEQLMNTPSLGGLGILEWYSILCFLFFVGLGFLQENSRNIS